jgi:hypothetical protein
LFNANYEMSHGPDFASRYTLGIGEFDYNLGAILKWTPFPNTAGQPAAGFRFGLWHAKEEKITINTTQVAAMVSKKFTQDFGALVPFAALALNFTNVSGMGASANTDATQLSIGSELHHKDINNMMFTGEIGMSIKDAESFVAVAVIVPMSGDKAFFKRR